MDRMKNKIRIKTAGANGFQTMKTLKNSKEIKSRGLLSTPSVPAIKVSDRISEAQRIKLKRCGIKIVSVEDMVKRREQNVKAFRKMGKPGFSSLETGVGF